MHRPRNRIFESQTDGLVAYNPYGWLAGLSRGLGLMMADSG